VEFIGYDAGILGTIITTYKNGPKIIYRICSLKILTPSSPLPGYAPEEHRSVGVQQMARHATKLSAAPYIQKT